MEDFLVASIEKLQGQTLLSSELCALAYWNYHDESQVGIINFETEKNLLSNFRFNVNNWKEFQSEFDFGIQQNKEQFLFEENGSLEKNNLLTFDFFRYIYLERNF